MLKTFRLDTLARRNTPTDWYP